MYKKSFVAKKFPSILRSLCLQGVQLVLYDSLACQAWCSQIVWQDTVFIGSGEWYFGCFDLEDSLGGNKRVCVVSG